MSEEENRRNETVNLLALQERGTVRDYESVLEAGRRAAVEEEPFIRLILFRFRQVFLLACSLAVEIKSPERTHLFA